MRLPLLLAGTPSVAVPNRAAMAPGLLERAAITHCARCAANNRPIVVSAEMHAISQRGLEGGDARLGHVPGTSVYNNNNSVLRSFACGGGASSVFGQVQLAAGGANSGQVQAG